MKFTTNQTEYERILVCVENYFRIFGIITDPLKDAFKPSGDPEDNANSLYNLAFRELSGKHNTKIGRFDDEKYIRKGKMQRQDDHRHGVGYVSRFLENKDVYANKDAIYTAWVVASVLRSKEGKLPTSVIGNLCQTDCNGVFAIKEEENSTVPYEFHYIAYNDITKLRLLQSSITKDYGAKGCNEVNIVFIVSDDETMEFVKNAKMPFTHVIARIDLPEILGKPKVKFIRKRVEAL